MARFLAPVLALVVASMVPAQDVRFVDGDLGTLKCSVKRRAGADDGHHLVRVTVTNAGSTWAEPTAFVLTCPAKRPVIRDVWHAPAPHVGRVGAGVAPGGGKREYVLQLAAPKNATRWRAVVAHASFWDASVPLPEPKIELGAFRHDTVDAYGRSVPRTTVPVRNRASHAVDAVFLAQFARPNSGPTLVSLQLDANEQRDWILDEQSFVLFGGTGGYSPGADVTRLELVGWTRLVPSARVHAASRARFERAWNAWERLPDDHGGFSGRFVYVTDDVYSGVREATGTFTLPRSGFADAKLDDANAKPGDASGAAVAIGEAWRDLMRGSVAELLGKHELVDVDGRWMWTLNRGAAASLVSATGGAGLERDRKPPLIGTAYHIVDGVVVGSREGLRGTLEEWRLEAGLRGSLVASRERVESSGWYQREQFGFGRVGDVVAVTSWSKETQFVGEDRPRRQTLNLLELEPLAGAVAAAAEAPTGDGVAALRAAWTAPYRWPATPVGTLRAKFTLTHRNTDGVWAGVRKIRGTLRIPEFTGFVPGAVGRAEIELVGKLDPMQTASVASALRGRLAMWASRGLVARRAFEVEFANATVDPERDGVFVVRDAPRWSSVRIRGGRPVAVENDRTRHVRRFEFVDLGGGGTFVAGTIHDGDATLEARWTKLADGWWVPTTIEFERVFGDEWGPERLVLSSVKVD